MYDDDDERTAMPAQKSISLPRCRLRLLDGRLPLCDLKN